MLNPEYADYENGNIKIGLTDDDGDQSIEIILSESRAFDLGEMLIEATNLPAKEKRKKR